ncbi:MAG TPA: polyhydroxyalkanoate depolymerase [Acetobacteraceae bacterium]|nr:polyhydroxyalkanoate depolymerase [Acetobacteraceae bacterium]
MAVLWKETGAWESPAYHVSTPGPSAARSIVLGATGASVVWKKPFGRMLHLGPADGETRPTVLVIAPLSGQRPGMLWDMLTGLSCAHDVYLLAWEDAREIPLSAGSFGLGDNIAYVFDCVRHLGEDVHLIGLCQSVLPALAATALLAQGRHPVPRSLTLLGGKLDTRINPARVDQLTRARPLEWFAANLIRPVPPDYPGAGRLVYPGYMQQAMLLAYLTRHLTTGGELLWKYLADLKRAPGEPAFIDELLDIIDVDGQWFLDLIAEVFHSPALRLGELISRGVAVDPAAICDTALLTVEAERDDIAPPGQTSIAHALCPAIPDAHRAHLLLGEIGHFGLYHGPVWRSQVLPLISDFVQAHATAWIQCG